MSHYLDHIITMQQSLAHYERILSHSHPAYISHLRYSLSEAKGGMDKAILALSLVTICFLATQVVTSKIPTFLLLLNPTYISMPTVTFGINVHIPHNAQPGGPYYVFGVIVSVACAAAFGVVGLCRWWWLRARRKWGRRM